MSEVTTAQAGTPSTPITTTPSSPSEGVTPQAGGGTTTPPVQTPAWLSGLSEDQRGFAEMKNFKDLGSVIDSYKGLEKVLGVPKERVIRMPEKSDDEAGWNEVYNRLGRPATSNDYKLDVPEKGGDESFMKWAKDTFHKNGLTARQAENISKSWNETMAKIEADTLAAEDAALAEGHMKLKREWGVAFDQKVKEATAAASQFGIDAAKLEKIERVLGFVDTMKFFGDLGSKIGEDAFVSGNSGQGPKFGPMTPAAAKAKLESLKGDSDFRKRFESGDADAFDHWTKLHGMAYPQGV